MSLPFPRTLVSPGQVRPVVPRTLLSEGQVDRSRVFMPPREPPKALDRAGAARWAKVALKGYSGPDTVRHPLWSDRDDGPSSAAPPADAQKLVIGVGLAALAVLLGVVAWQALSTDPVGPAPDASGTGGPILRTARRVIPCDFGSPLWDEMLGGALGPGRWKLYEKGYGTTCGIVVGYVLEQAGADPRLINRGDRFKIGAHISRLYEGGKAIGALRMDAELEPGDVYYMLRDGGKPGVLPEHVGIVLARNGDELVTGDGGQKDANGNQCARIVRRTIKGNRIHGPFGGATCGWRLSLGG